MLRRTYEKDIDGIRNNSRELEDFLAEVETTVEYICENPRMFPLVEEDIRRALLHKYPYGIFYVYESEKQRVTIHAVIHLKQHPNRWKDRR